MNQIFLPEYPYSYKLLLVNFFAIEQQQQLQREQEELKTNKLEIEKMELLDDEVFILRLQL